MRAILFVLSFVALCLGIFGYWGMFTKSGGYAFEEMDGMIPFFALVASGALSFVALSVIAFIWIRRSKKVK